MRLKPDRWLSTSGLKSETEGFIIAAQDQCLKTNYYRHKILKDGTDPLCRICTKQQETIDHLILGCPELAKVEYTQRHVTLRSISIGESVGIITLKWAPNTMNTSQKL